MSSRIDVGITALTFSVKDTHFLHRSLPPYLRERNVILAFIRRWVQQLSADDEVTLMKRIAQKDHRALEELYDLYSTLLYSVLVKVLRHEQEAEEMLQEVFLKIWEKAPNFDAQRGNVYAWLVTLARNRAIDRIRTERNRRLTDDRRVLLEQLQRVGRDQSTPLDLAVGSQRAASVQHALTEISGEQREVLWLAYFRGLSQSEIASQLELPLGTVKTRMRQGMIKLRSHLQALRA